MSIYGYLFIMFSRIGLFSFGGGYAMLPLIFQSVQSFGVMSANEFSNLVALSQVTPGPVAVNAATYVGFNYAGLLGAASATVGVVLPSFVIILLVSAFLDKYKENTLIEGIFEGIRPATVGLIASAAIFIAETSLVNMNITSKEFWQDLMTSINVMPCLIFVVTLILVGKFRLSPIKITIIMGVAGALICV